MSGAGWTIVGIVGGGLLLAALKWAAGQISAAVASQVVARIGDGLQARWVVDIDTALDDKLQPIYEELAFNGGDSVKDKVHAIHQQLEELIVR